MYVVPRRSLKLTILSCEALPPITSDRLWANERVRAEHDTLKRKRDQAERLLRQNADNASDYSDESMLMSFNIGPSALGSPQVALYMEYLRAVGGLQDFHAMYGDSAASDKKIAPNCYASVTLERNSLAPPLAVTEVKRANYDPFWNCTTEDINIDLMLLCGEMESATYLYCQRLRMAVYHDFGFGQDASSTGWKHDKSRDGLLIGEAFLAVGDLFADPCQKRHELKVYSSDHTLISGCTLHIETQVCCKSAKVPSAFPYQGAFPTMIPVEIEKDCGTGESAKNECANNCGGADVALSVCESISLPSAVRLAVGSSKGSRKCKTTCKTTCKSKCKSKCKSHRC